METALGIQVGVDLDAGQGEQLAQRVRGVEVEVRGGDDPPGAAGGHEVEQRLLEHRQGIGGHERDGEQEAAGAAQLVEDAAQHRVLVVIGDQHRVVQLLRGGLPVQEAEGSVGAERLALHACRSWITRSTAGMSAGAQSSLRSSSTGTQRISECSVSRGVPWRRVQ